MGRVLTNDFSWSKSRHEKFSECLRAYYLHYYGSWGGWQDDAHPDVRQLYILKKLSNRFTWAGSVVHGTIRDVLTCVRFGRAVDSHYWIERAHRMMRADYRHSRGKLYWREKNRREFAGLVEHEYSEEIAEQEWKRNWEATRAALTWFFSSRWIPLAKTLRKDQWLEVDHTDFEKSILMLDGVKVFAVPDFAYVADDGTPVVVDWKTGRPRDGYDDQILGYAMYLGSRYNLPVEKVQTSLVYLNEGVEQVVSVDASALDRFRNHFSRSVNGMRALLLDPTKNAPHEAAAFPMTEKIENCGRCVFRRVCGRDSLAPQVGEAIAIADHESSSALEA